MTARTRRLVQWLGAAVLVIALMVSSFLAGTIFGNPVLANVDEVEIRRDGLNLQIGARIVIIPRVRATFEGVDGVLHLGEQRVEYVVSGISSGDVLEPSEPQRVSVGVTLSAADVTAMMLRSVQAGRLTFDFDGFVHASVLGIPVSVPVTFVRTVTY